MIYQAGYLSRGLRAVLSSAIPAGVWTIFMAMAMAMPQVARAALEAVTPTAPHVIIQGEPVVFRLRVDASARPESIRVMLSAGNHRDEVTTLTSWLTLRPDESGAFEIKIASPLPLGWHRVTAEWADAAKPSAVKSESISIAHIPRLNLPADPDKHPWGVGAYWAMRYQPDEAGRAARQMRAAGLLWNRDELLWDIVEPEPGRWTWERTDMAVKTAHDTGIEILGLLDYWGRWSKAHQLSRLPEDERERLRDQYMRESIPHYANYCRRMVERYKPGGEFARMQGWTDGWGVRHWEVWNEPATFWSGTGEMFGHLLKAASEAIRAADPEAVVFFANAGDAFDASVIGVAGMDSFDGVCPHYYCPPRAPEEGGLDRGMAMTRTFFESRGFTGPYWISESGWYSKGMLASMAQQAAYLARMGVMVRAAGMDKFLWYDYRNDGRESSEDTEHQFGLVFREGLAPKPAYAAYANLVDKMGAATFVKRVELHPAVRVYVFDRGDARIVAAWSTANEGALRADVPLDQLFDAMGNRLMGEIEPGVRYIQPPAPRELPLTAEPHFLVTPWPAERLIAGLEAGSLVNFAPIEIVIQPLIGTLDRPASLTVTVDNFGRSPITGRLALTLPRDWTPARMESPGQAFAPGSTALAFRVEQPRRNSENRYSVSAALIDAGGVLMATEEDSLVEYVITKGEADVDGDLGDWGGPEVRWFHLDSDEQAVGLEPYMAWNLSARFALRWSVKEGAAGLYFAARVADNVFVQPHTGTLVWQGDNWQLGFGWPVGAFEPDTRKWTGTQYSYGLSLTPDGPEVWRWHGGSGGEMAQKDIALAVRRVDEHTTVYEAFFPAGALAPIPLASGTTLRVNALLNDNDGGGRRGWLELSPGIGTGFNPSEYFEFTME